MNKQRKADMLLVLVTGFWGVSYLLADLCLEQMPPLNLNAFRFLSAFLVLGLLYRKRMRRISAATVKYALLVGLCLVVVYICCSYGLLYTSISNAGFICALPVVTTPLLEFLITRQRPSPRLGICLILCTAGLALLTLNDQFQPALGDIICLGVAIFYAIDLVITDRAVHKPDVDPLQMGILQLGVVGVVTLILSLLLEKPVLPPTPGLWAAALFLGIFCSGVAFVVQTVQQQYTTASHVGPIFTLEPLFSSVVAYIFAGEVLHFRGYIGAALMMGSLLLMEVNWSKFPIKRKKKG